MIKKNFFLLLFLITFQINYSQSLELSVYSEISIITCGPGEELYEAFGHSAFRIKDPVLNLDLIYNYGMFDFNAPNFYGNFVKGKLLYKLARYPFHHFLKSYNKDKRWVKEQVLDLTQEQKKIFFSYLENNSLPQNANYYYDPYFDNCATRMVSVTKDVLGKKVTFDGKHLIKSLSYRELMNREMPWNTWGSFGINLALGSKLDAKADEIGVTYLPDYVIKSFQNAIIYKNNQPRKLVKKELFILDFKEKKQKELFLNPLLIFTIITLFGLFITYKDYKNNKRTIWLDFTIFFVSGVLGAIITFLWFFTNHSTTPNNFNFLWAFAPNLFIAFFLLKKGQQKLIKNYLYLLLLFLILIPFIWLSKIQQLPISILPILVLLMVRYFYLLKLLTFKK